MRIPFSSLVLKKAELHIKRLHSGEATGHDFQHALRVRRLAEFIAKREGANLTVVGLASLLHDIADWKFHGGDITVGPKRAAAFLKQIKVPDDLSLQVTAIIEGVSFKGAGVPDNVLSLDGQVVRDADRLDAIGAIGVARAFAYGGAKGREMYNAKKTSLQHKTFKAYQNSGSATINHFYEKLLLLKDRMHTKTGRRLAANRHRFMEAFLKQFFREWEFDGKK